MVATENLVYTLDSSEAQRAYNSLRLCVEQNISNLSLGPLPILSLEGRFQPRKTEDIYNNTINIHENFL